MARAVVAVIAGLVAAFVSILVTQAIGALVVPAGVAPSLKDAEAMRRYLAGLSWSAYAFVIAAYLIGSTVGGVVTRRAVGGPSANVVWITGGLLLAVTVANLVLIPHPVWFMVASVVAVFAGTAFAARTGVAPAR